MLILAFLEDTIGSVTSNDTPTPPNLQPPPLSVYICLHLPAAVRRAVVLWMRQDVAEEGRMTGQTCPLPCPPFSGSQMEACPPKSAYTPPPPASLPVLVHALRAMLLFGAEVAVAVSSPTVAVLVEKNGWVGGRASLWSQHNPWFQMLLSARP